MQGLRHLQRIACRLAGGRTTRTTTNAVQRAAYRAAGRPPGAAAASRWQARRAPAIAASSLDETQADSISSSSSLAGYEADVQIPTHCSGCGVTLQREHPDSPGCASSPPRPQLLMLAHA
jgi:hypothetical protein